MPRLNVEQKALTDPRFEILGQLLGSNKFEALGRILHVWNVNLERETYVLAARVVDTAFGHVRASHYLVQADLAEWEKRPSKTREGVVRIKGTEGRIEWLAKKRGTARTNGKKGGRPKKTPTLFADDLPKPEANQDGFPKITPPAPAPAPAPAPELKTKDPPTPAKPGERRALDPAFAQFWHEYPRKESKGSAERAWVKLQPMTDELFAAIMAAVRSQQVHGCLEPRGDSTGRSFIPHPATWLNARRWEDTPPSPTAGPRSIDARTAYAADTLADCFTAEEAE